MTVLRIGEVAIISYNAKENEDFIKSICRKIDVKNENLSFGRFEVNDQLALHLYGITIEQGDESLSWDLISKKTIGYIIIFNWDDRRIFEATKPTIDLFVNNFETSVLIIGNIKDKIDPPIPKKFFQPDGIPLSPNSRFTFCQVNNSEDAKKAMVLFVNMLIEKISL